MATTKTTDQWYTPAELEVSCQGWTPGAIVVIVPRFILRPDAAGRRELSERAPNGLQNNERFPSLIAQAEKWFTLFQGVTLTEGPTTADDEKPTTQMMYAGETSCYIDTKILRTVEHYCGAGYWTESLGAVFLVYRNASGHAIGLAAKLSDE